MRNILFYQRMTLIKNVMIGFGQINLDETYPKFFLEELLQMVDDIDTGKEKLIPMEDVMEKLKSWCEEPDDEEEEEIHL
jgi:hypothetical protein